MREWDKWHSYEFYGFTMSEPSNEVLLKTLSTTTLMLPEELWKEANDKEMEHGVSITRIVKIVRAEQDIPKPV